jgi:triacylglycerol lipase
VKFAVALVVVLLIALVALVTLWRRRRVLPGRRLRKPAPQLQHPVVLTHGLMGFDELSVAGMKREYFRGVPVRLTATGAKVHLPRLSPLASIAERAQQLADAVKAIDAPKVNLIAHSLGGLDARYAIARLKLAPRVASLVTIGSPHHGTPIADLGTSLGDLFGLKRVAGLVGLDVKVFYELTTAQMAKFNAEVPDIAGVWYGSLLARATSSVHPLLKPSQLLLSKKHGDNDGLVPATSQRWGEVIAEVEADHWAQIGWSDGVDTPGLYLKVIEELKARGF